GRTRLVGHSGFGEARHPRFSPDGRYLVWSQPTQGGELLAQLMVVDVKSDRQAQPVTTGKYNDFCPTFTRDGKYIAFLSDPPFGPSATGGAISETAEDPKSERTRGEKPATTAEIEFDGAEERIVPFPVSSGVFRDLEAVDAGLLWMRAGDAESGELGSKHAG